MVKIILTKASLVVLFFFVLCGSSCKAKSLNDVIERSDVNDIQRYIQEGADLNERDSEGLTPLHEAVRYKRYDIVNLLIKSGADVNAKTENGYTPLHQACSSINASLDIIQLLIAKGCDINAKTTKGGYTPLHLAVKLEQIDVVKYLIQKGASISEVSDVGSNVLHEAANPSHVHHNPRISEEITSFLIKKGADPLQEDKGGITAIEWALIRGCDSLAKIMVKGIDINSFYFPVSTPLHYAIRKHDYKMVKLLIENGADINMKDLTGYTPLHTARLMGNGKEIEKIIQLLVEHKARDEGYDDPSKRVPEEPVLIKLQKIAESGGDLNVQDSNGSTALHDAALNPHFDCVKFLISKKVNLNILDKSGMTPLFISLIENNINISDLLIENGADINIKGKDGLTAIHLAAMRNEYITKLLLDKGAEINVRQKYGYTPLHYAAYYDGRDIVELLIARGADVNARNNEGKTPLSLAIEEHRNDVALADLLRAHSGTE